MINLVVETFSAKVFEYEKTLHVISESEPNKVCRKNERSLESLMLTYIAFMQLGSIIKFAYKIGELIHNFKTSQPTHFAFVRGKRRNVIMQFRYLSNLFWYFT